MDPKVLNRKQVDPNQVDIDSLSDSTFFDEKEDGDKVNSCD